MKRRFAYIIILFLSYSSIKASTFQKDPKAFAKNTIAKTNKYWTSTTKEALRSKSVSTPEQSQNENIYLILESPNMVFDSYLSKNDDKDEGIPKNAFVQLLDEILHQPALATQKLIRASLKTSMDEYLIAQEIVQNYESSDSLNYDKAIRFLDNRFGYDKLKATYEIIDSNPIDMSMKNTEKKPKKLSKKIAYIESEYPDKIPVVQALTELADYFKILKKENLGITTYPPYTNFTNAIKPLVKQRTEERITWRPTLNITYPTSGSVWKTPSKASIKWETKNIDTDKSIKFFLTRDDIVVQVLGVYKNKGALENLELRKGLPEGDTYKVMGIELYPSNKFHIAKFATPYFSIRKERQSTKSVETVTPVNNPVVTTSIAHEKSDISNIPIKDSEHAPKESAPVTKSKSITLKEDLNPEILKEQRTLFAGRKISYQKKIVVDTETLTINLYDHGRQDGDIVSIYLNGIAVVANHILTYQKKSFEVHLDPSKSNDLFLYAHNLGNFPPNTVSLEIKDNSKSEEIVLNSDLKSCEAVLIEVQQ